MAKKMTKARQAKLQAEKIQYETYIKSDAQPASTSRLNLEAIIRDETRKYLAKELGTL